MRKSLVIAILLFVLNLAHAQDRPNVLVVMLDDANDYIGRLNGHPQAYTPNMDAFLSENIHFQIATPAGTMCAPARAAFLTGLTPVQTGIWHNVNYEEFYELENVVVLPEAFEDAGYTTTIIGKLTHPLAAGNDFVTVPIQGFHNPRRPKNQSGYPVKDENFDWSQFPANEDMGDYKNTELFRQFIEGRDSDENWLAMVGYTATHKPFFCPEGHFPLTPEQTELPAIMMDDQSDIPESGRREDKKVYPDMVAYGIEAQRSAVHGYLNCMSYTDFEFGRLMEILEDSEFAENTIVVLTSDHGYLMGEKQWYGKLNLWQPNTHGLFGMKIPGVDGKVIADPVNIAATMATLLDLVDIPDPYEGSDAIWHSDYRSLSPLIEGKDWDGVAVVFETENSIALQAQRYKYIFSGARLADVQVYDLLTDPHEWYNIADTHNPEAISQKRRKALQILAGENVKL